MHSEINGWCNRQICRYEWWTKATVSLISLYNIFPFDRRFHCIHWSWCWHSVSFTKRIHNFPNARRAYSLRPGVRCSRPVYNFTLWIKEIGEKSKRRQSLPYSISLSPSFSLRLLRGYRIRVSGKTYGNKFSLCRYVQAINFPRFLIPAKYQAQLLSIHPAH